MNAMMAKMKKNLSRSQIDEALTGLKCRCATHMSIARAVKRAAQA